MTNRYCKQSAIKSLEEKLSNLALQAEGIQEELAQIRESNSSDYRSKDNHHNKKIKSSKEDRKAKQIKYQAIVPSVDRKGQQIDIGDRVRILTSGKFKATRGKICNISGKGYVTIKPKSGTKIVRRSYNVEIIAKSAV